MKLERMHEGHVERVVEVHLKSFPCFFLTFLGRDFLRLFYRGFCKDGRAVRVVAMSEKGEVAGFVAGALNPAGFFSGLLKRDWWRFSVASVKAVLKRPAIIPRLARALFHPSGSPAGEDVAMLISLGVSPGAQGKGVGKELVKAFLLEAGSRGAARVMLATDRDDNEAVNGFYVKAGFVKVREYVTREGRHMNEYAMELKGR